MELTKLKAGAEVIRVAWVFFVSVGVAIKHDGNLYPGNLRDIEGGSKQIKSMVKELLKEVDKVEE